MSTPVEHLHNTGVTVAELIEYEAMGLVPEGQGARAIAEGMTQKGGKLPVNTNGGLLGEAYIHGMNLITEAARQIRGTAVNQVAGAQHAAVCAGRSALVLGTF